VAEAQRDDGPTESPGAPAEVSPEVAALRETVAALTLDNMALRAKLVERDTPPPLFLPLKMAAGNAEVPYKRALGWHRKGLIESRKDVGRIVATVISIIERRMLIDGK
jgi:hypothetical protein